MSDAAEVRQFALDQFDQRYAALRLQATEEARRVMIQSLGRYGQIAPLVVWPADDRRFSRSRNLPNRHPTLHDNTSIYTVLHPLICIYYYLYALNYLPQIPVRRWVSESVC